MRFTLLLLCLVALLTGCEKTEIFAENTESTAPSSDQTDKRYYPPCYEPAWEAYTSTLYDNFVEPFGAPASSIEYIMDNTNSSEFEPYFHDEMFGPCYDYVIIGCGRSTWDRDHLVTILTDATGAYNYEDFLSEVLAFTHDDLQDWKIEKGGTTSDGEPYMCSSQGLSVSFEPELEDTYAPNSTVLINANVFIPDTAIRRCGPCTEKEEEGPAEQEEMEEAGL